MSESLVVTTSNFDKNVCQIKIFPISSNAKINEILNVAQSVPKAGPLKSIVKKSGRHLKKSIWSEYLRNQTRKHVKFNAVTKVLVYDDEKGVRGAKETLEDLMTDTIQQHKNAKYRKIENISYQEMLKMYQKNLAQRSK